MGILRVFNLFTITLHSLISRDSCTLVGRGKGEGTTGGLDKFIIAVANQAGVGRDVIASVPRLRESKREEASGLITVAPRSFTIASSNQSGVRNFDVDLLPYLICNSASGGRRYTPVVISSRQNGMPPD